MGAITTIDLILILNFQLRGLNNHADFSAIIWCLRYVLDHPFPSVYCLLFDLPTCTIKDVPLLQKEEEREEAYSLLEALAGSSKDAFVLLGRRLMELHGTSLSEPPLALGQSACL